MEQCQHPISSHYRSIKAPAGELFCLKCKQIIPANWQKFKDAYNKEAAEKLLTALDIN